MYTKTTLRKMSSPAQYPRYEMTIPAGTKCTKIGSQWVVADTSKVEGSNAHDLAHYHIWLNDDEVIDLALTAEEIERYKPYHTMAKFFEGFADYEDCRRNMSYENVDGQAYDRGAECAMERGHARLKERNESLYQQAGQIIERAERDLKRTLSRGERTDLLMDNTDWPHEVCKSCAQHHGLTHGEMVKPALNPNYRGTGGLQSPDEPTTSDPEYRGPRER